jgi:hypothetical protein
VARLAGIDAAPRGEREAALVDADLRDAVAELPSVRKMPNILSALSP